MLLHVSNLARTLADWKAKTPAQRRAAHERRLEDAWPAAPRAAINGGLPGNWDKVPLPDDSGAGERASTDATTSRS